MLGELGGKVGNFTHDEESGALIFEPEDGTAETIRIETKRLIGVQIKSDGEQSIIYEVIPPSSPDGSSTSTSPTTEDPRRTTTIGIDDRRQEDQPDKEEERASKIPKLKTTEAKNLPASYIEKYRIQPQATQQPPHLSQFDKIPNLHVIISTESGTGLASIFWKTLLKPFLQQVGYREYKDYAVHETRNVSSVSDFAKNVLLDQANKGVVQRVILLAGDGGVVDLLNGLHSKYHDSRTYREPVIVLLPMGTGNALANSCGVVVDETLGLSTLARGKARDLPIFRAEFSVGSMLVSDEGGNRMELELKKRDGTPLVFGAVVCSWGLHAVLVADSDTAEYRRFGAERFKMAANDALYPADGRGPHVYKGRVSLLRVGNDGNGEWIDVEEKDQTGSSTTTTKTEHAYVLTTLVSNLESGFTISPLSRPLDGKLRVVHFGPTSGDEAMRLMNLAYAGGKHVDEGVVGYEEVEGARIEFLGDEEENWRRVCVDGKIVVVPSGGSVTILKERGKLVQIVTLVND